MQVAERTCSECLELRRRYDASRIVAWVERLARQDHSVVRRRRGALSSCLPGKRGGPKMLICIAHREDTTTKRAVVRERVQPAIVVIEKCSTARYGRCS